MRKLKSKKAQATMEFVLCIPIVFLATLGTLDIARANIVKLETTMVMQQEIGKVATGYNGYDHISKAVVEASRKLGNESFFCTATNYGNASCSAAALKNNKAVKTKITSFPSGSGTMKAGGTICLRSESTFKPFYSGIFKNDPIITAQACTIAEKSILLR